MECPEEECLCEHEKPDVMPTDALLWTLEPKVGGCLLFDDTRGYLVNHILELGGVDCFSEHTASMHRERTKGKDRDLTTGRMDK